MTLLDIMGLIDDASSKSEDVIDQQHSSRSNLKCVHMVLPMNSFLKASARKLGSTFDSMSVYADTFPAAEVSTKGAPSPSG